MLTQTYLDIFEQNDLPLCVCVCFIIEIELTYDISVSGVQQSNLIFVYIAK